MAAFDPDFDTTNQLLGLLHPCLRAAPYCSLLSAVKIPEKFAELDRNGSGEVDYEEFCEGFGFADTALTKKLFDAFDYDLSGQISVVEVTIAS